MISLFSSDKLYTLADVRDVMRQQILSLPRMVAPIGDMDKILRFEYRVEPLDLLGWLHNQKLKTQIYLSARDGAQEVAGVGCADQIVSTQDYKTVLEKMHERLSADNPRLRYYGGFAFCKDSLDAQWDAFGASRFLVSQFEFVRTHHDYYFAFHINIKHVSEEYIQKALIDFDALDFSKDTTYRKVPEILHREDLPQKKDWKVLVDTALKSEVDKTVLARRSHVQFDLKLRPNALIKFLKDLTPHCFHFCLQLDEQTGFLGASPERLFQMKENQITSEAIAGTASAEDLLDSSKCALEQKFVVDALKDQFQALCTSFSFDQTPSVLKLKEACHLQTSFKGVLKPQMEAADVLTALHPTPAVSGSPKQESSEQIKALEPFARGWYAAPVGSVGYDECEFFVAIRSGLIFEGDLYLYAGAGIVEGSIATEEWDEIEQKMSRFMKVFS